jgi:DNA polymerase III delta subunit
MLYFLHGPDSYRSRRRLNEIVAEFEKKTGAGLAITRFDAGEHPEMVFAVGRTASLFHQKELFLIERLSDAEVREREYAEGKLESWAEARDITVIIWEAIVDREDMLSKKIEKHATKTQEFKILAAGALDRWITAEAGERKVRLTREEQRVLLTRSGGDLWAISNELDKIAFGSKLDTALESEANIFAFTDAFLARPRSAFRPLSHLLRDGHEPVVILATLAGSFRSLATVWWGMRSGKLKGAAKALHPFVVKKYSELARTLTPTSLARAYEDLVAADISLKTGKLPPPYPLIKLVLTSTSSPRNN